MSRTFVARGRTITIDGPVLMGIVNASPESFSGDGSTSVDTQAARAVEQFAAGALVVDVGGQSANTKTPELAAEEETARLVPLIEAIRRRSDGLLSVDTYKPTVADDCLRAGADIINDVSALHDPGLAEVVARWDAGFVLMHTVGPPKVKLLEPDWYADGVAHDVAAFFDDKLASLEASGVPRESVVLDPGVDFSKTPRQSVELLHDLATFSRFDRPMLLALSRKDFVGAISGTSPRQRDPGTLGAMAFAARLFPETIFRVHEVDQSRQFLDVMAVLGDPDRLEVDTQLSTGLRLEPTD
ncbi:dihydropteroate synthase [Actinospongicola halichondriae]|uniref:dihydropteroate synthase n=1 Tax=Actinospongicola halichondriae TaxID=3236844 RepID=UPI003D55831B